MEQLPVELSLEVLKRFSVNQLLTLRLVASDWNRRICGLFGSKFVYYLDAERLKQHDGNLAKALANLDTTLTNKVCIRQIDLLRGEEILDEPIRSALGAMGQLHIDDCELAIKFLCFIVNRMTNLETLQLSVLLDKSNASKLVHLRPGAFDGLAELNLSHSSGMEDRCLVRLAGEMPNLQVLNCIRTKMVFYPNVIRRYYQRHDDLESCWLSPTNFGFTFTIVRAMLSFATRKLKKIHLGPNLCLENVTQLLLADNLEDVYLAFPDESNADQFRDKVLEHPNMALSSKRFHYVIA